MEPQPIPEAEPIPWKETDLSSDWELSLRECGRDGLRTEGRKLPVLKPISLDHPSFSGEMVYRKRIVLEKQPKGAALEIQHLYEAAYVYVNGERISCRICPPYSFDLGTSLRQGENLLEVRAANTAVRNANKPPASSASTARSWSPPECSARCFFAHTEPVPRPSLSSHAEHNSRLLQAVPLKQQRFPGR